MRRAADVDVLDHVLVGARPASRRSRGTDTGSRTPGRSARCRARRCAAMCSGRSRRASSPPCTAGCSVFTRPSSISGKPVTSATSRTARPASRSARAVPPVESSSQPRVARPRGEVDDAGLVGDGKQGARHGNGEPGQEGERAGSRPITRPSGSRREASGRDAPRRRAAAGRVRVAARARPRRPACRAGRRARCPARRSRRGRTARPRSAPWRRTRAHPAATTAACTRAPYMPGPPNVGQQGGVDVEHAPGPAGHHVGGHQLEVAGEHDEVDVVRLAAARAWRRRRADRRSPRAAMPAVRARSSAPAAALSESTSAITPTAMRARRRNA